MNEFLVLLQAKLDEAKSKENIDSDIINKLQGNLKELEIAAKLDPNAAQKLANDIGKLINQKITISNININTGQAVKNAHQSGKQIGNALNESVSSSIGSIKKNIADTLKGISSLNANDIIKNLNLNRASVGNDVVGQVRLLVSEVNNLGRKAAKTNSDSAWEQLISKCTELGKVLDTFGKTRSFSGIEEVKKFADYFNGKTISVGYKSSGLSGTDLSTGKLNKELKDLGVQFSATKQEAISLDTVWEEMCNTTGRMDLLNITTAQDQLQTIISELQKAQSILNGEQGLVPHPNAHGDVTKYLTDVERARDTVINLQNEMTTLMQKESQESTTFADQVVKNENRKQQAIQQTANVQRQLKENGNIIQQTDFTTSFNTKDEAETYFNTLSKIVHVQEKLGENKNLNSFIVEVKNAEGAVEKLTYKYNELTSAFEYSGGSINNNGVQKQIDAINIKASRLQDIFKSLQSKYSDLNASNPIKEQTHITELENQYKKVEQAIEAVKASDSATFSSMVSNAESEIKTLQRMGEEFKRAETISMRMNGSDISSGLAQAQERFQKLKANSAGFEQMTETIQKLNAAIAVVGDKSSLKTFIDQLKVAEAQLDRVKAETKSMAQVNKIQLSMEGKNTKSKNYDYQIDTEIKKLKDLGFTDKEVAQKVKILTDAQLELKRVMDSNDFDSVASKNKAIIESDKERTIALNQVRTAYGQLKNDTSQYYNLNKQTKLSTDIQNWLSKNSRASKEAKESLNAYYRELSNGRVSVDRLNYIEKELKDIDAVQRGLGKLGKNLKDQFKEAGASFTQWLSVSSGIMALVYQLQKIPKEVIAVNKAMVELTKVSDASSSDITKYFDEAADSAKRYGSTVSDMINATADWSRLGYNLPDAKKLAEVATLYTNVGDGIDMSTANESLISTLQGFKMTADEAIHVIDAFNEVANTEAINSAGIGEALQRSASSMYAAGNTLEETIGLVTAANAVVQDPDSIGTAYKTISMRIRGAKTEMEELGLETDGMVESTSTLQEEIMALSGVDIMKDKDTFKSTYQILDELAAKWQDLTDIQQASITELIAGKRQGNIVSALMSNFDTARRATETAVNSTGSALKEQEEYEKGIEYSLKRLEAVFQVFANHILDSSFVKGIVDFGSSTIEVIDKVTSKLGSLGTIGLGAGLFAGFKNAGRVKCNPSQGICLL